MRSEAGGTGFVHVSLAIPVVSAALRSYDGGKP